MFWQSHICVTFKITIYDMLEDELIYDMLDNSFILELNNNLLMHV